MFTFAVKSRRNDSMNQDSDIRQFFQAGDFETFCKTIRNMAFNDSELCYFPYAMTATSHLTIDSSKIVFADDAKELLDISLE